ncbi:MAG TPA: glycosyltransferase [Coleofasciculaceae cyanobacterium]
MSFKSSVKNRLREGLVHFKRMTSPQSEKRLVIFPFWDFEDSSSRERAYNLGENLRTLGWRVTIVPFQLELEQRRRILQLEKPKILYIQKGRHQLNFPELYDVPRIVFDLDDADFVWPDDFATFPNQKDQIIRCCQGSDLVICGSKFLADFCRQYNSNTHIVWTGMANQELDYPPPSQRQRIIAWGTSSSVNYVGEREFLGDVMIKLREKVDFEFWVYGATDFQALQPFVDRLAEHNIQVKLFPLLSFDEYHNSLENAVVGLHPIGDSDLFSLGKSFGKLNSYMLRGVPIVVHRKLDYPEFFQDGENGMLASELEEWVEKIYQLLVEPALRDKVAAQAKLDFQRELSSRAAAQKVHALLETLLEEQPSKTD